MTILCRMLRHQLDPGTVWDDGIDLRGSCRRCRTSLLKDTTYGWRELDPEVDYSGRGKLRTVAPDRR
jgi:hypothetical protein